MSLPLQKAFDCQTPPLQKSVLAPRHEQILGIRFFNGNVGETVEDELISGQA
jgi:hypothetical protein